MEVISCQGVVHQLFTDRSVLCKMDAASLANQQGLHKKPTVKAQAFASHIASTDSRRELVEFFLDLHAHPLIRS